MSPTLLRRKAPLVILVLLAIVVVPLFMVSSAAAEGAPYREVPGYPKSGCYDVAVGGQSMWGGQTPYPLQIDVPGPVVDAYFVWIGTIDYGAPDAPNKSDLLVNDTTTMIGTKVDERVPNPTKDPYTWYMWRADAGPSGLNLVQQGMNKFTISGWKDDPAPGLHRRNGISLVVVYSTGACTRPNKVDLIDNMDYYFVGFGEPTTDAMTFTFPPAPVDREVKVKLHYASTDHVHQCRPENVWAAVGNVDPPPAQIVNAAITPSRGINGGQLAIKNAFIPATCNDFAYWAPVTSVLGWEPGYGWKPNIPGYIGPEWAIDQITVQVPAGATWIVLQGESVNTGVVQAAPADTAVSPDDPEADFLFEGESGAWFGQASIPLYNPDLKITKTDGVTDAKPGDTNTYTLDYENSGFGAADNVTIVDKLPDFVSYVSATNGGVFDSASRTVTWNVGTLNIGQKGQVQVVVKLDPVFEAGTTTLTNTATISTTAGELNPSDNTATDTTNVFAKLALDIAKKGAPEPVDAGNDLTYTVDWSLTGDAFAHDLMIVDSLPAGVTFASASDGGVYNAAARTVTWSLGSKVAPVKNGPYTVVVNVPAPQYNGTKLVNNVTISDKAGDKADALWISTVRSSHELKIEKLASPEPVDAGSNLTYTVNWAVTGNEPAKDAKIVDTLPTQVEFVSATGGGVYDAATRTVTWNLGELMTPKDGSFTVVVAVKSPQYNGTQFTNKVDFSDKTPGSTPTSAEVISTVRSDHELSVSKTGDPNPVAKGAELNYTVDWKVTGNEPADSVTLTDPIPFGTKFVSASDGGAYDAATNTVTWALGNQVPGDAGSVTLVVLVNKDFPNALDITNRVTISDARPGKEKSADVTTKVVQTAEGAIGDTVWIDANGNGIREPGESGIGGVSLILNSAGADGLCGTADDAAIAATTTDANGKYRFDAVPAGTYCVNVVNATVPAGLTLVSGTNPHGPIVLAEGQIYLAADFGYQAESGKGVIGDRVWNDANGNGLQDPGEVGLSGVSLSLSKVGTDGVCGTADDVAVATTTSAVNGSYLFSGLAPDTYCVKATDPVGATLTGGTNPHGPIVLSAGQTYLDADFGYKTDCNGQIGNLVFYDGNRNGVYNGAPIDYGIGGVTLSLMAPGVDGQFGTADDVTIATTTTAGDGSYLFSGLANGAYRVVVTDLNGRLLGYTQTYGVPNTDNNGQVSPLNVTIAGCSSVMYADFGYADGHLLSVTKVNDVPAGKPVEAGADMVYTIGYSVTGREPAPNVMLSDPLPLQLDFIEASNGGTYDSTTRLVSWSLGTLPPGTTGTVTLKVHVKKPLPNNSYIFNTVTIIDEAKVRDEATDVIRVHAEPILSLTKTVDPTGTVKPGDTLKYTICGANTGNGDATGVMLTDKIPDYTTLLPGSYPPYVIYDPATKTLGIVPPGGVLPPTDTPICGEFQVKVDLTLPGVTENPADWTKTIHNIARLVSVEKPALTAETSNPLNAFVKPTLTKTADPAGEVKPGDTIKYTLCYANQGTANLTGVVLKDVIPVNTTYVVGSATGTGKVWDEATKTLTWNIGVLAPAASTCVTFEVTVNMTIEGLTGQVMTFAQWNELSITNTATLKNEQVGDKTATAVNPLKATVDPKIYKTVNSPVRHMGETVVFTVTVTNQGTANANDVVLTDVIHPKLEGVTLTSTKGETSYDPATRKWTVTVGLLAPNETVTVVIQGLTVRVPASELPYQITNSAVVAFKEGAARESNQVTVDVVYHAPGEIPEPGTWLLLGSGLAGLAGFAQMRMRSRRRKQ